MFHPVALAVFLFVDHVLRCFAFKAARCTDCKGCHRRWTRPNGGAKWRRLRRRHASSVNRGRRCLHRQNPQWRGRHHGKSPSLAAADTTMSLPAPVVRQGQRGTTIPPPRPPGRSLIEAWLNLVGPQSLRQFPPLHLVAMRLKPPPRLLQRPRLRLIRPFIPCCAATSQLLVAAGRRENLNGIASFRPNPLRLPPRRILAVADGQPAERVVRRPSLRPHHGRRGTATSPLMNPRVAAAQQTAALGPPRRSCSAWRACGRRWGRPRLMDAWLASTQASHRLRRSAGVAAAAEVGPLGQKMCPSERQAATRHRHLPLPPPPLKTCPSALRGGTTTRQGRPRRLRRTCPSELRGRMPRRRPPLTPTRAQDTATAHQTRPPAVPAAAAGTPRPRPLPRSVSSRPSSRCSSPSCAPRPHALSRPPRRPRPLLPALTAAAAVHPTTTTEACLGVGRWQWRVLRRPCEPPRGLLLREGGAPPPPPPPLLPRLRRRPTPTNTPPALRPPRWRSAGQALPLVPTEEEEAAAARASEEAAAGARGCLP